MLLTAITLHTNPYADKEHQLARRDKGSSEFGERKPAKKKHPPKSALSLDVFSRAKQSTYDKRVVLEKQRNLAAGKVNKFRKVQKRLGDSIDVAEGFDPERYQERLNLMEEKSGLPKRNANSASDTYISKKGRVVDFNDTGGKKKKAKKSGQSAPVVETAETKKQKADSDSDDEFGRNVVEREGDGDGDGDGNGKNADADADDDTKNPNNKKNTSINSERVNKGWNKQVKDGLKNAELKLEKEKALVELKKKWAVEDAGKKKVFQERNTRRDQVRMYFQSPHTASLIGLITLTVYSLCGVQGLPFPISDIHAVRATDTFFSISQSFAKKTRKANP